MEFKIWGHRVVGVTPEYYVMQIILVALCGLGYSFCVLMPFR